ncbi:polyphosphate kinase 1 [Paenibacillus dokdonensis]|uniref:Polyphosphate kinase n=2 Tax=Paenibacillus dokdonensis TaxID=2567944 RepID=A0ABU6GJP7_9BACL|nr:polyphosphate kinase 1 [Paenibacillus dokdonensis]MEC0239337.1 polyphosphate kinase 1 [Paenibacillus dokdonensis]
MITSMPLKSQTLYMQNRELSWLRFNERVLEEAMDERVPLIERLKFVSIFTSNLDEFYMIRVGSLTDLSVMKEEHRDNKTGWTAQEQLDAIFAATEPFYEKRNAIFAQIEQALQNFQIYRVGMEDLNKQEKKFIEEYYEQHIFPILSPVVVDSHHPFPHLKNKQPYVMCSFEDKNHTLGIIPVSPSFPDFIPLPGESFRYILTSHVILGYAKQLLNIYKVSSAHLVSVTRNADIALDDENLEYEDDDDIRLLMKKTLKKRARLAPVRLEVEGLLPKRVGQLLCDKLQLSRKQVFNSAAPIVMNYPFDLIQRMPKHLKLKCMYPPFQAYNPLETQAYPTITEWCLKEDMMLYYPYDSMDPFLQLLKESAEDPQVVSIKITIYRLAQHSIITQYLSRAAENQKDVAVLIELQARFDEQNNIEWAERLEEAGCQVIYGVEGYKVHSKMCLITRKDRNRIQYITHISTGNYNEKTAKLYTDISIMTSHEEIGRDADTFFKNMAMSNLEGQYQHLLVAPNHFRQPLLACMDREIEKARRGEPCRILMKSNSLTDIEILQKLSEASEAGVPVQLIIRGICCLLPGVPDHTENVAVRSIVGRFLEHSRIFCFGADEDCSIYISSGDLMTRSTTRRVETACPVYDPRLKQRILHQLDIMLRDNDKARQMSSNGQYKRLSAPYETNLLDSQKQFIDEAMQAMNRQHPQHWRFWRKWSRLLQQ